MTDTQKSCGCHTLTIDCDGREGCEQIIERVTDADYAAIDLSDAYQGAREDLSIWKRRALKAEQRVREQGQIIDRLGDALNAENGPTHMGEPVIPQDPAAPDCRICNRNGAVGNILNAEPCPDCTAPSRQAPAAQDGGATEDQWRKLLSLPDNLVEHRGAWLDAMDRLIELEPTSSDPLSCAFGQREYWAHERRAMLDMYADLDRRLATAAAPQAPADCPRGGKEDASGHHPSNGVIQLKARIAELEDFAREIVKQYPNPDITHEQFRVHACRHAAAVIEQDCEGGTP